MRLVGILGSSLGRTRWGKWCGVTESCPATGKSNCKPNAWVSVEATRGRRHMAWEINRTHKNKNKQKSCDREIETHKRLRTKSIETFHQIRQILQVSMRLIAVFLRCLIEEDTPNGQVRIRRCIGPRRISLNVPANQRDVARRISRVDIPQKAHVAVRRQHGDFAGIIRIGQGIRTRPTARIDYDGKIDIGVGGDPGGVSATDSLCAKLRACCVMWRHSRGLGNGKWGTEHWGKVWAGWKG